MSRLDIALLKPGSQKALYGDLSDFALTAIEPPFWGALLAAYLREKGFGVALFDAEAENWSPDEAARALADAAPRLAVIVASGSNPSASTMNMLDAGTLLARVKELAPDVATMLFGLHPSALPQQTLCQEKPDFVCQGEGFFTLPPLLEALAKGGDIPDIDGLWRIGPDGAVTAGARPKVLPDLDALPMPAWDLLPMDRYRAHNWHCFDDISRRQPYAVLSTSLGCPFHCTFCCINALFGHSGIRFRSTRSVLDEIDWLVKSHGVRNIKILDEMFAINEQRVIDLCEAIASRGYDLNFWAYARVNTVTRPMMDAMKRAGINWLAYGFESASKKVLRANSKGYDLKQVDDVVEMTRQAGIAICANFIVGLPEDDFDSMQETLVRMMDINAEWANIYSAMAYPGSKLYEQAVREGLPLPETWRGYSQYSRDCRPLPTKHLTSGQVLAFRDYAFDAYYRNPRYLDMIRRKYGLPTARHIVNMASRSLRRDHAEPFSGYAPDME